MPSSGIHFPSTSRPIPRDARSSLAPLPARPFDRRSKKERHSYSSSFFSAMVNLPSGKREKNDSSFRSSQRTQETSGAFYLPFLIMRVVFLLTGPRRSRAWTIVPFVGARGLGHWRPRHEFGRALPHRVR